MNHSELAEIDELREEIARQIFAVLGYNSENWPHTKKLLLEANPEVYGKIYDLVDWHIEREQLAADRGFNKGIDLCIQAIREYQLASAEEIVKRIEQLSASKETK